METFEIFTIGSGYYLEKIFNAINLILHPSNNFTSVMKLSALAAVVVITIRAGLNSDFKSAAKWFFGVTILVGLFLTGKANVQIIDTLPDSYGRMAAPRHVNSVPWGLALIGSVTSSVGNNIAQKFDESLAGVFNNPDYQKTGLLFGSKIVEDTSKFRIEDSDLKQLMLQFYKKCIVPDLNMGYKRVNGYSLSDLTESPNILEFLKDHSSKARIIYVPSIANKNNGGYLSCHKTADLLYSKLDKAVDIRIPILAKQFNAFFSQNASAQGQPSEAFKAVLEGSYGIFIRQSSINAKDILLQNIAINSLSEASGSKLYGKVATESMTKLAYNSVGQMAQKFIPILRAVLECLFYGVFPLVLILLVTPIGLDVLKNYAFGFIYLQLWQPMYAILFCIASSWGKLYSSNIVDITFSSLPQIALINEEISSVSGYMLTLVPVLSLFITKGMVANMGNLASSIIYIPQSTAVQNADSAIKGNYQIGSTSINTHQANTSSSNKFDDNYNWSSGMKSFSMTSGAQEKMFSDGRSAIDSSGAVSNTAGLMEIDWSKAYGSRLDQNINDSLSKAEHHASRSTESATAGFSKLLGFDQSFSKGSNAYEDWKKGLSSEQRSSIDEARSHIDRVSESHGISQQDAVKLAVSGNLGVGGKLMGATFGLDASTSATKQEGFVESLDSSLNRRFADNLSKVENIATSTSHQDGSAINNSMIDAARSDFADSKAASLESSKAFDKAHSLQQSKSAFEQDSSNITQKLTNMATEKGIKTYGAAGFERMIRENPHKTKELVNMFADEIIGKDISGTKAEFENQKSQLNTSGISDLKDSYEDNREKISKESSFNIDKVNKAAPENFKNEVIFNTNSDFQKSIDKDLTEKNLNLTEFKDKIDKDSDKLEKKVTLKNQKNASRVLFDSWSSFNNSNVE
jgi:conjugal transfer mating pair stabilization protein TraG